MHAHGCRWNLAASESPASHDQRRFRAARVRNERRAGGPGPGRPHLARSAARDPPIRIRRAGGHGHPHRHRPASVPAGPRSHLHRPPPTGPESLARKRDPGCGARGGIAQHGRAGRKARAAGRDGDSSPDPAERDRTGLLRVRSTARAADEPDGSAADRGRPGTRERAVRVERHRGSRQRDHEAPADHGWRPPGAGGPRRNPAVLEQRGAGAQG